MENHSTYNDDQVFEKLEHEASRHHHRSSRHSHYHGTKPTVTSSSTRRNGPEEKRTAGAAHPAEHREEPARKSDKRPDPPEPKPAKGTASVSQDLSSEIGSDLKKTTIAPVEGTSHRTHHSSQNHKKRNRKDRKRAKSTGKKRLGTRIAAAVIVLLLAVSIGGYGFLTAKLNKIERTNGLEDVANIDGEFDSDNQYGVDDYTPKLITSEDVTNILLIGQDRRKGDAARMRSDSMIVCSINRKTREITLTSLMRDMYLPIPDKGYGMINATYLAGGFPLLNETIEKNFGIRIDGNVEVDFDRFIGLMTLIGPISLNLSQEEADHLNQSGYNMHAGVNTLDSEQVLAYCRMRKNIGGDWGRTDRQRKVISRIYQELRTSGLPTIYRFIDEALPLFRTDLSNRKMIQLAYAMVSSRMGIRHSYRLPEEGTYTQEIREDTLHVLIPDVKENSRRLQKYIYGYLNAG